MRVLLVGHACSPRRGSELAGTWNWAWHLSQTHEVWVMTHPQEQEAIEGFLASRPNKNLHFVWATLPSWLDPWDPKDDNQNVRFHYPLWQRFALRKAIRLHREVGFEIVHHVSWGTVSEPPPLWRLPIPFVWGPLGGGQVSPPAFKRYFGPAWRGELLRFARMRWVPYRPALRSAVRKSALILATNSETSRLLVRAGATSVLPFLDSGLRSEFLVHQPPVRRAGPHFKLLWVGQMERRKCLPLALEALAQTKDLPISLLVAGRGPLREEWERLVHDLGLRDRVSFLGQVPYLEMPALYRSADAFIFTSLRDSFGSQVLEAMASGLPVIALDHQGVGAFVPAEAGVKVPVTNPEETVLALGNAIRRLAGSDGDRSRMGRCAWEFAVTQSWERRAQVMSRYYEGLVQQLGGSKVKAQDGMPQRQLIS